MIYEEIYYLINEFVFPQTTLFGFIFTDILACLACLFVVLVPVLVVLFVIKILVGAWR